jgi:hypothetical protein
MSPIEYLEGVKKQRQQLKPKDVISRISRKPVVSLHQRRQELMRLREQVRHAEIRNGRVN